MPHVTQQDYMLALARRLRAATQDFIQAQLDFEDLRRQAIARAGDESTDTMIKFLGSSETRAAQADLEIALKRVTAYSAALQGEAALETVLPRAL